MDIGINEVKDMIESLEINGEVSIKEEKYLKVAKMCVQLAAENVALKEECGGNGSYRNCPACTFSEYIEAPETPATNRIVAGIKADGVEEFIGLLQQCVDEGYFAGDEVAAIVVAIDCGKEFFEQLREGANHD